MFTWMSKIVLALALQWGIWADWPALDVRLEAEANRRHPITIARAMD